MARPVVTALALALAAHATLVLPAPPVDLPPIPLTGYICPTCPSTPHPSALLAALHPAYTTVIFAFAGWDATGAILNQYDAPDKGFTLNASVVSALKAQGRRVLLSAGGGAGNVLVGPPPAGFSATIAAGLAALVAELGLDGIDLDLENFQGDPVSAMGDEGMRATVRALRATAKGPLLITMAPQMTDVYPEYSGITAGFNRYAPLVDASFLDEIDCVMPQMYNSWGAVETVAFAESYVAALNAGYTATGTAGVSFNVTIPGLKLALGYPASRSAAGSGFIVPGSVVSMVRTLAANNSAIAGLMTWDCGWDEQSGWAFADAVAAG